MKAAVDPKNPYVEVERHILKDVHNYQYYQRLAESTGKELKVLPDTPKKPPGAVVLSRTGARDVNKYVAAQEQARRERRPLWIQEE